MQPLAPTVLSRTDVRGLDVVSTAHATLRRRGEEKTENREQQTVATAGAGLREN